ncbi:MAG: hypothetical protein ACOY32_04875 [Thermodesulfobacteriota bacterium]
MKESDEVLRQMWQHEDTIANHRLSWFTTVQGLLFTALALVARDKVHSLLHVLVGIGIGVCCLTFVSLLLGVRAKMTLLGWWEKEKRDYSGPPIVGYYVRPGSWLAYLAPTNLLPVLFLVAWIIIALLFAR